MQAPWFFFSKIFVMIQVSITMILNMNHEKDVMSK